MSFRTDNLPQYKYCVYNVMCANVPELNVYHVDNPTENLGFWSPMVQPRFHRAAVWKETV